MKVNGPLEITLAGKISSTPGSVYTYQVLPASGINFMCVSRNFLYAVACMDPITTIVIKMHEKERKLDN